MNAGRTRNTGNTDASNPSTENGAGAQQAEASTRALTDGIAEITRRLHESLADLYPPLINLAQAHCRDVQPHVRAAVVLSAGGAQPRDMQAQERLLLVASALEMLAVALSIHRLLLLPTTDTSLDKALVGSTILTGDYCFSRAAVLAAQTESPAVVNIFSQALKQVSEENLRTLLADEKATHGEDAILAQAGVRAAFALLEPDSVPGAEHEALQTELATLVASRDLEAVTARVRVATSAPSMEAVVAQRWLALVRWLAANSK